MKRWDLLKRITLLAGLIITLLFGWSGPAEAFSAADIYRRASDSVVLIFGFEDSGVGSSGTGSVLTQDGLVLTNNHVISSGNNTSVLFTNIVVYLKPNPITGDNKRDLKKPFLVDVIANNPKLDLALLQLKEPPPDLQPIEIGDSEEVDIGENVAAIGHPGGGGLWTLTTGTVSSKRRDQSRDIFQTDTAINPGSSGGPLLDRHARLVGVNTFVRRVDDQGLPLEGLRYSLRGSLALHWIHQNGFSGIKAVSRKKIASASEDQSAPQHDSTVSPSETKLREFTTPDGTTLYGVPNFKNDLQKALQHTRKEYTDVIKHTDQLTDDIEKAIEGLDKF